MCVVVGKSLACELYIPYNSANYIEKAALESGQELPSTVTGDRYRLAESFGGVAGATVDMKVRNNSVVPVVRPTAANMTVIVADLLKFL